MDGPLGSSSLTSQNVEYIPKIFKIGWVLTELGLKSRKNILSVPLHKIWPKYCKIWPFFDYNSAKTQPILKILVCLPDFGPRRNFFILQTFYAIYCKKSYFSNILKIPPSIFLNHEFFITLGWTMMPYESHVLCFLKMWTVLRDHCGTSAFLTIIWF